MTTGYDDEKVAKELDLNFIDVKMQNTEPIALSRLI